MHGIITCSISGGIYIASNNFPVGNIYKSSHVSLAILHYTANDNHLLWLSLAIKAV